jgi:hypothetical protein
MGATAKYALPYPDNSNAADVPYDVKRLADAVDAQLQTSAGDTGWVDVAIAPGFVPQSGAEKPQVRRIGKVVYMRGGWQGGAGTGITAAGGSYYVGTVPAGFRPPVPVVAPCGSSSAAAIAGMHVQSDGQVQVRLSATVGAYYKADGRTWTID